MRDNRTGELPEEGKEKKRNNKLVGKKTVEP
jgi:hypothetical protein